MGVKLSKVSLYNGEIFYHFKLERPSSNYKKETDMKIELRENNYM